jgi:hypothetical protein
MEVGSGFEWKNTSRHRGIILPSHCTFVSDVSMMGEARAEHTLPFTPAAASED